MPPKTVITSGCSPLLTCTATVPPHEKTTSSKCGERKICREVVVIFSKLLSCNALLLYQKLEFHCYNKENTCPSIHDRSNRKKDPSRGEWPRFLGVGMLWAQCTRSGI